MIQHNNFLLVEWNERYKVRKIIDGAIEYEIPPLRAIYWQELPTGNYSIIGMAKDLTEEQWKEIVDRQLGKGKFRHYEIEGTSLAKYGSFMLDTATESGLSLLASHSLKENNCLILKQNL